MKQVIKTVGFSALAIMTGAGAAFAANTMGNESAICGLIQNLGGVFKMLRTLAFVGAAFIIAGWAWDFISKGKVELSDLKTKGVGMLVGFVLLFSIGIILTFLLNAAQPGGNLGCVAEFKNW